MKMRFDELFEMRKLTGTKLKDYIRSNFCRSMLKTKISMALQQTLGKF